MSDSRNSKEKIHFSKRKRLDKVKNYTETLEKNLKERLSLLLNCAIQSKNLKPEDMIKVGRLKAVSRSGMRSFGLGRRSALQLSRIQETEVMPEINTKTFMEFFLL